MIIVFCISSKQMSIKIVEVFLEMFINWLAQLRWIWHQSWICTRNAYVICFSGYFSKQIVKINKLPSTKFMPQIYSLIFNISNFAITNCITLIANEREKNREIHSPIGDYARALCSLSTSDSCCSFLFFFSRSFAFHVVLVGLHFFF